MKLMHRHGLLLAAWFLSGCIRTGAIHPEAQRLNALGARYLEQGQLQEAEQCFQLGLEYSSCYPEAWHNLAVVSLMQQRLAKAEQQEEEALRCRSDFVQAVSGLGSIRFKQGALDEAMDLFASAVEMDPGYVDARRNLIITAVALDDVGRARMHLLKLKVLAPSHLEFSELEQLVDAKAGMLRQGRKAAATRALQ